MSATRHVNIKFSALSQTVGLAHPALDTAGIQGDVSIYRVENVPADVKNWQVMELFSHTAILFPDQLPTPYTVDFSQLGYGKIIKGANS
ncbi:hypothetical protein J9253_00525 [Thiothrix litoralis]|jgi:hypothetical protein|uniref:Uncharacterized protein n=1 Tax=Thiothrix litoralis TaxID=2891210 RepID=A0ABX7WXY4_9GAMM|nr:hypothetical protein [Thiothrix litoralis]QTR46484.1 hypothetical protein J9253_00525 [Thiothrix litoralis]